MIGDSLPEAYGNRFYVELRRLSGFDFMALSYEDIQRLKIANQETTYKLLLGNSSFQPKNDLSPEEFAVAFVQQARQKANDGAYSFFPSLEGFGELGNLILICMNGL